MDVESAEFARRMGRGVATVACLAGLLLTGCDRAAPSGGATDSGVAETTDETGAGDDVAGAPEAGAGGAPGAPGRGDRGQDAPGSPMRMPARTEDMGVPLGPKLAVIERELIAECGGSLCVRIKVVYRDPDRTRCQYYSSDPAPGSTFRYRKNMTVTIIAGSRECEKTPESEGPSDQPPESEGPVDPPPESEEPPTDPGGSTEEPAGDAATDDGTS